MTAEGVTAAQVAAKADASATVNLTGDQTIAGIKTFSSRPVMPAATVSMVRLNTANGYGSTNTMIRRFTNSVTNTGSDITYADSATLGASFTIATAGVYAISFNDEFSAGGYMGITLNTTAPTTAVQSTPASEQLCTTYANGANGADNAAWTGYLAAGSVVRAHTAGGAAGAGVPGACQFTITRVA